MDQPFDVRRAIEQSSSRSTLQELAKKGIHRVKVLDESMINKLIGEAVERIVSTKTNLLSSDDRQKIIEASRKELDRLMKEHQQSKDKAELMERDKQSLATEIENLQEQVKQTRKLAEEQAKQRYEDGKAMVKAELEDMKRRMESADTDAEKRLRKELELEFKLKNAEERMEIEKLKTEAAREKAGMIEEMRKTDEQLFLKISELFTKSIEGVNKKLTDIKLRTLAGGGGGGGGGMARMEGDEEFRPSAATLESLVQGELESNLKGMQAEAKVSGKISNALDRLKAMRGGGGGEKKEEKK
jgi:chromosome segregation ATPase